MRDHDATHSDAGAALTYAAMLSSNSGPLFRGEPTRRSTGPCASIHPSGAGHKSATRSPSTFVAITPVRSKEGKAGMSAQAAADLILGVTILMPLTVCLVVVAVTWTLEDLAAWSEERAKRGRQ